MNSGNAGPASVVVGRTTNHMQRHQAHCSSDPPHDEAGPASPEFISGVALLKTIHHGVVRACLVRFGPQESKLRTFSSPSSQPSPSALTISSYIAPSVYRSQFSHIQIPHQFKLPPILLSLNRRPSPHSTLHSSTSDPRKVCSPLRSSKHPFRINQPQPRPLKTLSRLIYSSVSQFSTARRHLGPHAYSLLLEHGGLGSFSSRNDAFEADPIAAVAILPPPPTLQNGIVLA
ncbi:hypothetical protein HYPSUDRAFT_209353 [Hypholoma sublateritium FD-334 SS-4]|uniref:Uncharacterized protein n=1 Tax=Hypholoma sublateritium (strain FD-334 SS-4) TaxID=945553 RepID=A0A0D2KGM0_HYPSF|nr:hypothetical protein HYPSUDRAFT_209353 [Hypholoma sublateritium FD-334 SS-4]